MLNNVWKGFTYVKKKYELFEIIVIQNRGNRCNYSFLFVKSGGV